MLQDIINKYQTIAIVGMEKNTGKTTALNYFIRNLQHKVLGLTSIGRDGENTDLVTSTYKPEIYVYPGTVAATTTFCLAKSDITKEILHTTGIDTPIGEVVLVRAKSAGYVELAGPSFNQELKQVIHLLKNYCSQIFVDGALSRKSSASPSVADCTILSTGGAVDKSLQAVVNKTLHSYRLLTNPSLQDEIFLNIIQNNASRVIVCDYDYTYRSLEVDTALGIQDEILSLVTPDTQYVFLRGAVTDSFVEKFAKSFEKDQGLSLVVEDGTKVFISEDNYARLNQKNIPIYNVNPINVAAITVNPTSPFGYVLDGQQLIDRIQQQVEVEVFNVKEVEGFAVS